MLVEIYAGQVLENSLLGNSWKICELLAFAKSEGGDEGVLDEGVLDEGVLSG